jgi:hypothetical protein
MNIPVEMEHECARRVIMLRRQSRYYFSDGSYLCIRIFDAGHRNELLVQIVRQQWIRQSAEIVLEDRGDATNIVEAVSILQIKRCIISAFEELSDSLRLT